MKIIGILRKALAYSAFDELVERGAERLDGFSVMFNGWTSLSLFGSATFLLRMSVW